jgi:hypothetical protein
MTTDTAPDEVQEYPCQNHPNVLTAVGCGKCGAHLCPRCMVFTPVGVRCRDCAQMRKPAQFDVPAERLALVGIAALATAVVAWLIALQAFFFIWLMAILVGLAVGEVASRVAKRRVSRPLEVVVGAAIVGGFLSVGVIHSVSPGFGYHPFRSGFAAITVALDDPFSLILIALAVVAGVTRLRR